MEDTVTSDSLNNVLATNAVLIAVSRERMRQRAKFGTQRHDFPVWMTVLGEEFGEACQAILRSREDGVLPAQKSVLLGHARNELVQVAAVAVAAIEHLDELTQKDGSLNRQG